ncbi:DnaJ domain-containing protein [Ruegeria lacuscaerulensis]|uniref:DnaJ domain-containing protein n=1 Tax=Ruegeria lacuscaerulensis TaxID=55218 RepID=UPI001BE45C96|nr:DnaJ domain-containing protein [Ruegeria lacuscaerulensis]
MTVTIHFKMRPAKRRKPTRTEWVTVEAEQSKPPHNNRLRFSHPAIDRKQFNIHDFQMQPGANGKWLRDHRGYSYEYAALGDEGKAALLQHLRQERLGGTAPKAAPVKSDCWGILGVEPNATHAEAKAAYRRLVKLTHPDAGGTAGLLSVVRGAWAEAEAKLKVVA